METPRGSAPFWNLLARGRGPYLRCILVGGFRFRNSVHASGTVHSIGQQFITEELHKQCNLYTPSTTALITTPDQAFLAPYIRPNRLISPPLLPQRFFFLGEKLPSSSDFPDWSTVTPSQIFNAHYGTSELARMVLWTSSIYEGLQWCFSLSNA